MKNVQMSLEGDTLTITVNMKENHGKSASGKSTIIASTEGNQSVPGTDAKIGLNIYKK